MTSTSQKPESPGKQTDEKEAVIVIPVSAIKRARGLSGSQYDLWLYLYEQDRYGKGVDIPTPENIGKELGCHARTVFRNTQQLIDRELFEFEIEKWRVCNIRAKVYFSKNSTDKEIQILDQNVQNGIKMSKTGSKCPNPILKPALDGGSGNGQCTNNKQRSLKNKTIGTSTPPTHPVLEGIDREGIGTNPIDPLALNEGIERLSALIEQAGARPNKTIQRTLATLLIQEGAAAAARLVENAISALREQQAKGTVRNIGGFIVTALRRHFTANQSKFEARIKRQKKGTEPISLNSEERQIDSYLAGNHRDWALAKLQSLWEEGWHDQLEELILLRRDWGFSLTERGVRDGRT